MPGERFDREIMKQSCPDVEGEMSLFSFKTENSTILKPAPCVYLQSLKNRIFFVLDQLKRLGH